MTPWRRHTVRPLGKALRQRGLGGRLHDSTECGRQAAHHAQSRRADGCTVCGRSAPPSANSARCVLRPGRAAAERGEHAAVPWDPARWQRAGPGCGTWSCCSALPPASAAVETDCRARTALAQWQHTPLPHGAAPRAPASTAGEGVCRARRSARKVRSVLVPFDRDAPAIADCAASRPSAREAGGSDCRVQMACGVPDTRDRDASAAAHSAAAQHGPPPAQLRRKTAACSVPGRRARRVATRANVMRRGRHAWRAPPPACLSAAGNG